MTCPFCGAAARTERRFQCWTLSDLTERSETCMELEIENLKARIARLEESLDALTAVIGSTRVSGDFGALQNAMDQALVVLGNKEAKP